MTQGDYVTLECSKRLKELGYDGKTSGKYVEKVPGTEREEWDEEEFMMVQITDVVTYPKVHLYDTPALKAHSFRGGMKTQTDASR